MSSPPPEDTIQQRVGPPSQHPERVCEDFGFMDNRCSICVHNVSARKVLQFNNDDNLRPCCVITSSILCLQWSCARCAAAIRRAKAMLDV